MEFKINQDIAILTFDDGKANAVSHDFIDDMMSGLDNAETNAKAVVILGKPGVFSAGFDLKEISRFNVSNKVTIRSLWFLKPRN